MFQDPKMKKYYVYILANKKDGVLYIGVTSNIIKRVYEHKANLVEGFTNRYQIKRLVYYEILDTAEEAIIREKKLKNWHRDWKINLINHYNPNWNDLYAEIIK